MEFFVVGDEYPRKALLAYVGSNQPQSGIIWGKNREDIVICTSGGRHGERVGYEDCPGDDGTWFYFGQGEKDDQDPKRYANRLLVEGRRAVLLFTTRELTASEVHGRGGSSGRYSKMYRYRGAFRVETGELFTPSQGKRTGDRLLRFLLVPDAECQPASRQALNEETPSSEADWLATRQSLIVGAAQATMGRLSEREYGLRSRQLKAYAKMRADGTCEFCRAKAPFVTENNEPFLEVHHIMQLAHDGINSPANVLALCPNCHRRAHYGIDMLEFRETLIATNRVIEASIDRRQGPTTARIPYR